MKIHTLGCGSAKPTLYHQPSSTVVEHHNNLYMVDCGEGAQTSFLRARLNRNRLSNIFLTHLHGDHVFGLPGLLSTMELAGTRGSITIHTFEDGKEILSRIMSYFSRNSGIEIRYNVISAEDAVIFENSTLRVRTVKLRHSIPAVGFIFEEKTGLRHLNREMCDFYGVPISRFNLIRAGANFETPDGRLIDNSRLTFDPTPAKSYAHISDTAYIPELAAKIEGVNLLFHETTYLESNLAEAVARGHSTARQAAMVARDAHAGALLTGHYSSRYHDDTLFLKEAEEIFPNVILNREGLTTEV